MKVKCHIKLINWSWFDPSKITTFMYLKVILTIWLLTFQIVIIYAMILFYFSNVTPFYCITLWDIFNGLNNVRFRKAFNFKYWFQTLKHPRTSNSQNETILNKFEGSSFAIPQFPFTKATCLESCHALDFFLTCFPFFALALVTGPRLRSWHSCLMMAISRRIW